MRYVKTPKRAWRGVVLWLMLFFSIGAASPAVAKTITMSPKYFPDKAMREALYPYESGEKMTQVDLNNIDILELVGGKRKINLKGIKYFPKLSELSIQEGAKTRTLPKIPKLEDLDYDNDVIGKLKFPYYPKLESLSVYGRNIKQLDLSKNKQVQNLLLGTPKLENLDVSFLSNLEVLELEKVNINNLDLSANLKLRVLRLTGKCGELPDFSVLPKLEDIVLRKQELETLELSEHPNIETISLDRCGKIKKIHIANCPKLKKLCIEDASSLQEIQIEGCGKFKWLEVEECPALESVVVDEKSQMLGLEMIKCGKMTDAGMERMDLSKLSRLCLVKTGVSNVSAKRFPKLKSLKFYKNGQKEIDFRSLKNLQILRGGHENKTKVLDVSMLPKLRILSWPHGALERIRLGKESRFCKLNLSYNKLSGEWHLQKFTKLEIFNISHNGITFLDLGKEKRGIQVCCSNNKLSKVQAEGRINLFVLHCQNNPGVKVYMYSSDDECMDWKYGKNAKVYYKYG